MAHDCVVGDDVILTNAATLGATSALAIGPFGGSRVSIGFAGLARHAMVGGASPLLLQDIAPYVLGQGNPFGVSTVNAEGLKRRGFSPEAVPPSAMRTKRFIATI